MEKIGFPINRQLFRKRSSWLSSKIAVLKPPSLRRQALTLFRPTQKWRRQTRIQIILF